MSYTTRIHDHKTSQREASAESRKAGAELVDNRPSAIAQRRLAEHANAWVQRQGQLANTLVDNLASSTTQRKLIEQVNQRVAQLYRSDILSDRPVQAQAVTAPNRTGMPDTLKSGIENLSGMSMDHVKVHYNSDKPAQLNAHAYAQGGEIHLAPGQEKHLPHEAWHLAQQAQGRVTPTRQFKSGVMVNDSSRLEAEADQMGARAIQAAPAAAVQRVRSSASTGPKGALPMQRKIRYVGGYKLEAIARKLQSYADKEKLPQIKGLATNLPELGKSPIEYGEVDLSDYQHVGLLYNYLEKRRMDKTKEKFKAVEKDKDKENTIAAQEGKLNSESEAWAKEKKDSGSHLVYKTAFLGAGASVAYALQTLGPNEDPADSVIIGPEQPWRNTRGPGVVAHPAHMVTPLRQRTGGKAGKVDDIFVGRARFSDHIQQALKASRIEHIKKPVMSIKRPDGFYVIEIEGQAPVFAKKIVAGLGVGGHDPKDVAADVEIAHNPNEVGNIRRVMDMDVWAHVADKLSKGADSALTLNKKMHNPGGITIILSGGNGGIDVAFDALNRGYKVHWIVGNAGPKFLPGFFNYAAYLPYLRTLGKDQLPKADVVDRRGELNKARRVIPELYASQKGSNANKIFKGVADRFLPNSKRFEGIYFGYSMKVTVTPTGVEHPKIEGRGPIKADLLVYAQGQDNKTFKLLEDFLDDLMPQTDIDRRFGDTGTATLGLQNKDKSLEVIGATGYRLAPQVVATNAQKEHAFAALDAWSRKMRGDAKDNAQVVRNTYLAFKRSGAKTEADKFNNAVKDYEKYLAKLRGQHIDGDEKARLNGFNAAVALARSQAQGPMSTVINTLPDNVLINDQLTPTRSQVEAASGFVPRDIAKHVNFIADDRTQLAVHIFAKYPALADSGKYKQLLSLIIASRTKRVDQGPPYLPVPPNQKRFQKYWNDKLVAHERSAKGKARRKVGK